jgi:hypothetical protein
MIKKYNQFVDEKINEEFVNAPSLGAPAPARQAPSRETETIPGRPTTTPGTRPSRPGVIPSTRPSEQDAPLAEVEEEEGDFYGTQLTSLAVALGLDESDVIDNKLDYEGKEIIFPSETEKFHVDNKRFKTVEETVAYLQGDSNRIPKLDDDRVDPEFEAKSYKFSRREKRLK